jgi:hypothetical protein
MNIPSLGDFVCCGTDLGHVLGIYVRRVDENTGVMRICAEYVDNGYKYRWLNANTEWDDVPFTNMLAIAHPERGFYAYGVAMYANYCERRYRRMSRWLTPKNTRRWLYAGIRRSTMRRHLMAYNLSRLNE